MAVACYQESSSPSAARYRLSLTFMHARNKQTNAKAPTTAPGNQNAAHQLWCQSPSIAATIPPTKEPTPKMRQINAQSAQPSPLLAKSSYVFGDPTKPPLFERTCSYSHRVYLIIKTGIIQGLTIRDYPQLIINLLNSINPNIREVFWNLCVCEV